MAQSRVSESGLCAACSLRWRVAAMAPGSKPPLSHPGALSKCAASMLDVLPKPCQSRISCHCLAETQPDANEGVNAAAAVGHDNAASFTEPGASGKSASGQSRCACAEAASPGFSDARDPRPACRREGAVSRRVMHPSRFRKGTPDRSWHCAVKQSAAPRRLRIGQRGAEKRLGNLAASAASAQAGAQQSQAGQHQRPGSRLGHGLAHRRIPIVHAGLAADQAHLKTLRQHQLAARGV